MNKLVNIIYEMLLFVYNLFYPISNYKGSIIINDTNDITILEISDDKVDRLNILRYLNNNIKHTNDAFYKEVFDSPIRVKFEYLGRIYRICLSKIETSNNEHTEIEEIPKILSATVEDTDITEIVREYHGHTKNFYKHIPDVIYDLSYILELDGDLHTYDTMGNYNVYVLKNI